MTSLTFHKIALEPLIFGLKNTHAFITKGYEHAKTQKIDPNDFLSGRLHPDMMDFRYQIYRFTDAAKFIPPRVNPSLESITLPDEEQTFEELLARIEKTTKYLESFTEKDFEGKEGEEVVLKFRNGTAQVKMPALDYVQRFGHPNFWFHITTAYGILRMKGVEVGKFDYLNGANMMKVEPVPQE